MSSVGRSWRTPGKHDLMWRSIGREVAVASRKRCIERLLWIDLTAGDGVLTDDDLIWQRNVSPGIQACHARSTAGPPVEVTLYEQKPATYDRLLSSLAERLPPLGYEPDGEAVWRYGDTVTLRALNVNGSVAPADGIRSTDAVYVINDPNAMTDWAMRPSFAAEIAQRTPWFRSISTMGCNPGGLKRSALAERLGWFEHVARQEAALPRHRDLLIAAIERDDAQWAYLLCESVKWRTQAAADAGKAFAKVGRSVVTAWHRAEPERFEAIKRHLFLTRREQHEKGAA